MKSREVDIYCLCRMPKDKKRGMVQCSSCRKWFHIECVSDGEIDMEQRWLCLKCEELLDSLKF